MPETRDWASCSKDLIKTSCRAEETRREGRGRDSPGQDGALGKPVFRANLAPRAAVPPVLFSWQRGEGAAPTSQLIFIPNTPPDTSESVAEILAQTWVPDFQSQIPPSSFAPLWEDVCGVDGVMGQSGLGGGGQSHFLCSLEPLTQTLSLKGNRAREIGEVAREERFLKRNLTKLRAACDCRVKTTLLGMLTGLWAPPGHSPCLYWALRPWLAGRISTLISLGKSGMWPLLPILPLLLPSPGACVHILSTPRAEGGLTDVKRLV